MREAPDFQTFIKEYYSRMRPVGLKGGIDHWPALKRWTPEYFWKKVGHAEVEIQYGRDSDPDYERNARKHKKRILMRDFVEMVINGGDTNDYYMTASNTRKSLEGIEPLVEELGDFHEGYRKPESFSRQNLLWFGPKGTFTPLHHDLTNNMLVQIYGRKKVTVYSPFQVPYLYNDKGVFSEIDVRGPDHERNPLFQKELGMEVILEPADAIFYQSLVGMWWKVWVRRLVSHLRTLVLKMISIDLFHAHSETFSVIGIAIFYSMDEK